MQVPRDVLKAQTACDSQSQEGACLRATSSKDQRYQELIAQSAEGIWCCEIDQPIPLDLPIETQVALMLEQGFLAECNDAMAKMYGFEKGSDLFGARLKSLFSENPANREFLKAFIQNGYCLADVESEERGRDGQILHFANNLD